MKKFTLIGMLTALLFAGTALGQIVIADDFEVYTVDQQLVLQAHAMGNTNWQVWGTTPGSVLDPLVKSIGGTKALYSDADKDPLLLVGEVLEAGTFTLQWDYYIESGKIGYFNILKKYDASNSENCIWGTQLYFREDGTGYIDAGESAVASFSYTPGTWNHFKAVVDLDNDWAQVYLDDNLLVEWEWSLGCFGDYEDPTLHAMNFFGMGGSSMSPVSTAPTGFYIDNIVCEQTTDPLPDPVISITPDDKIERELQTNSTNTASFYLTNEEAGTLKAKWSTYIEYSSFEHGVQTNFDLALCDPSEVVTSGVGSTGASTREIAMRLSPSNYSGQLGGEIRQVGFYVNGEDANGDFRPASDLTFRIYAQGPSENDTGEVLAETVLEMSNFVYEAWNYVNIDPVKLTGGDYWVAVEMYQEAGTYPLSTSGGLKEGGDMWRTNGGKWSKASSNPNLTPSNWAIATKGSGEVQNVWALIDKTYGTTNPTQTTTFEITFKSAGYPEGTYTANLIVMTNDPENPRFEVPVIMIVNDQALGTNSDINAITVNDVAAEIVAGTTTSYRVTLDYTEAVFIAVEPKDSRATVSGDIGEHAVKAGRNEFNIKVTAEDEEHYTDYLLTVMVRQNAIPGVDNSNLKIYPNPVNNFMRIESEFPVEYAAIYDLTGKMVKQIRQASETINVSDLSTGIYLLHITTSQGESMHKFVKQ